ncbi:MAG TPA: hypothetical protein VHM90_03070 [Phycisphaerae bacterium]|nr:hypothetical protein [Phycisphaerae bacterium]
MSRRILAVTFAFALASVATSSLRAADLDDAQTAIKKLADAPNYSWSSSITGGRGNQQPVEYKAEKDGYATFTAAGFQGGDSTDIVMKGDKGVGKMADGWKTTAELQKAADDAGGFSPELIVVLRISNFSTPAAQAKSLLEKATNVKKAADGTYTADLAAANATDLLSFRRPGTAAAANAPQMTIKDAKGTLKLTLKDGMLSKMEIHLTGTRNFNDQDTPVDQTTTLTIKDVGTTKVTVPEDAKKKLDAAATTTAPAAK